jgi:two-component system sensor histidine kinase QseC
MQKLLVARITRDDIYIMLIVYLIASLLIWFIVRYGLASIRRVTDEVSHRVPNYLEPVNAQSVPREIKPLAIELNKLFLRLHQALEREKRFAGDAAHELRTPLAALKTQAQVTLKTTTPEERDKLLHNVIIGVDRCTHIVQQLLTLSRLVPESNTLTDIYAIDLGKLAAEVVAQLAPLALAKDIDIELVCNDNHPGIIQGNITALSILIRNLVDNAIRYTPNKGKITIRVAPTPPQSVFLKVIDNGPGIPAELRARVFERFFRILGSKSTGSGLGLAIVQQIAHLHHAQLRLGTPDAGKGLEVEVCFPEFRIEQD